uniref:Secreted protein n=1 Tax=Echinococcus canadensis TaxID=519352 RepID=A0A915EV69_9CEST
MTKVLSMYFLRRMCSLRFCYLATLPVLAAAINVLLFDRKLCSAFLIRLRVRIYRRVLGKVLHETRFIVTQLYYVMSLNAHTIAINKRAKFEQVFVAVSVHYFRYGVYFCFPVHYFGVWFTTSCLCLWACIYLNKHNMSIISFMSAVIRCYESILSRHKRKWCYCGW